MTYLMLLLMTHTTSIFQPVAARSHRKRKKQVDFCQKEMAETSLLLYPEGQSLVKVNLVPHHTIHKAHQAHNPASAVLVPLPREVIEDSLIASGVQAQGTHDEKHLPLLITLVPEHADKSQPLLSLGEDLLGHNVIVVDQRNRVHRGKLLSQSDGNCVLYEPRSQQTVIIHNFSQLRVASSKHLAEQLQRLNLHTRSKPYSEAQIELPAAEELDTIQVGYLTTGLSYKCHYRLILTPTANAIAWGVLKATLQNHTDIDFNLVRHCTLFLGKVNSVPDDDNDNYRYQSARLSSSSSNNESLVASHSSDYHSVDSEPLLANQSYELQVPLDEHNSSTIALKANSSVDTHLYQFQHYPVTPYYSYSVQNHHSYNKNNTNDVDWTALQWGIEVPAHPTMPLPVGNVIVYQQDSPTDAIGAFVGASRIHRVIAPRSSQATHEEEAEEEEEEDEEEEVQHSGNDDNDDDDHELTKHHHHRDTSSNLFKLDLGRSQCVYAKHRIVNEHQGKLHHKDNTRVEHRTVEVLLRVECEISPTSTVNIEYSANDGYFLDNDNDDDKNTAWTVAYTHIRSKHNYPVHCHEGEQFDSTTHPALMFQVYTSGLPDLITLRVHLHRTHHHLSASK
jgi:hypothetical protein